MRRLSIFLALLLLCTSVGGAWATWYYADMYAPSKQADLSIHVNQFQYDDPGSVLPGGPGTVTTTPEETDPEVPPEEPGGSTPEETTPSTPPTPSEPEVEDGENHYNLLAFIVGDIGQHGLNIPGGIIYGFMNDNRKGPEYSQDNTGGGGHLPKEFDKFNAENLQFILVFDKDRNPTICYAYTYQTISDEDEAMGTYVVVYKTAIEPVGTNGRWVATRAYKGYALVGKTGNKKAPCAPLYEQWTQGEIPG